MVTISCIQSCHYLEHTHIKCVIHPVWFSFQVYVATFAITAYASTYHRAGSKPFNPVLGETYECDRPDKSFRFIAEQVDDTCFTTHDSLHGNILPLQEWLLHNNLKHKIYNILNVIWLKSCLRLTNLSLHTAALCKSVKCASFSIFKHLYVIFKLIVTPRSGYLMSEVSVEEQRPLVLSNSQGSSLNPC